MIPELLFCPRCVCKRVFTPTPDAAPKDEFPPVECDDCGYEFRSVAVEHSDGRRTMEPAVSHDVRRAARRAWLHEYAHSISSSGLRLLPQDKDILSDG